jgi:ankyrin repeat protein
VKLVEFLIEEGVDVNVKDAYGLAAFYYCARTGNSKLSALLVERGADPFVSRKSDKLTALHAASGEGYFEGCRYLVEDCGLDIDSMMSTQQTPLCLAALKGQFEACRYLLGIGASVDVGVQPLMAAAQV